MFANMCVCVYKCFLCFSFSSLFVCFCSTLFNSLNYFQTPVYVLVREIKKGCGFGWMDKWGESRRSW